VPGIWRFETTGPLRKSGGGAAYLPTYLPTYQGHFLGLPVGGCFEGRAVSSRLQSRFLRWSSAAPAVSQGTGPPVFDLATCAFLGKREDALFLGPGGTGKSHLAQAIGQAAIQQGYRVLYRETHVLLDDLAESVADGTRKQFMESLTTVPLLIIDDFGMRKLPLTAAEDLLEIIMRRYERASTLLTSNRPVEDWGKLLGDVAAVTAMLDRILHHGHVLKCGPRSWRTKTAAAAAGGTQ